MTQLDISQAKASLSDLLDLAIKGEEIVITQDSKPIAKISPIKKPLEDFEDFSSLDPWTQSLIGMIENKEENIEETYIDYLEEKYS